MTMKKQEYEKAYKVIRKRYIPAILFLLFIFISRQMLIQYEIAQDKNLSHFINIAGTQRMLSQEIVTGAVVLSHYQDYYDIGKIDEYTQGFKDTVDEWAQIQNELKARSQEEKFPVTGNDELDTLVQSIESSYQTMLEASYGLISVLEKEQYTQEELLQETGIIIESEKSYLESFEGIVEKFHDQEQLKINYIAYAEKALFIFIICNLGFVLFFIILPGEKTMKMAFNSIDEKNNNILMLFSTLQGAMIMVEEQSMKVLMMNEDAKKLLKADKNLEEIDLENDIQWLSIASWQIVDAMKHKDKIERMEVSIGSSKGSLMSFLLSTIRGEYKNQSVILIGLYDITLQKKLEEDIKQMALKDELTGLYNRHYLDEKIKEELERSTRYNIPLSVAMLDLDHFKRINDNWGHPVGDDVLQNTANIMNSHIRASDLLFRFGGEEFLILMPHTDLAGANVTAENIRKAIEEQLHPIVGNYTVSIGVAQRKPEEGYAALYRRVDEALYHAKKAGRNKVYGLTDLDAGQVQMPWLAWNDSWKCGEEHIDRQHEELFYLGNEIIQSLYTNLNMKKSMEQLDLLLYHIKTHFA
ncbi:MAG: diguanylate cyclase, partial [Clostridiales bacterium]|nr:diguanylate cyclase [Clostridiales bacterium]